MNFIEAVKTGKKFKRAHWDTFYSNYTVCPAQELNRMDVLAADWQVEEEKVTLTKTELEIAYFTAISSFSPGTGYAQNIFDSLCRTLGFK